MRTNTFSTLEFFVGRIDVDFNIVDLTAPRADRCSKKICNKYY